MCVQECQAEMLRILLHTHIVHILAFGSAIETVVRACWNGSSNSGPVANAPIITAQPHLSGGHDGIIPLMESQVRHVNLVSPQILRYLMLYAKLGRLLSTILFYSVERDFP